MKRALRPTHVAAVIRTGRAALAGAPRWQVPSSLCSVISLGQASSEFAALRTYAPTALAWPPQVVTQKAVQALRRPMSAAPARERCLHSSAVLRAPTDEASSRSRSEVVDVLYDGECPLCVHEITWLRRRNQVVNLLGSEYAPWHASPRSLGHRLPGRRCPTSGGILT